MKMTLPPMARLVECTMETSDRWVVQVTYVGLAITCSTGDCVSEGGETKAFKILRLMRLAKLLRLARIKRLLQKYEDSVFDVTPFLGP